eukprot:11098224-Karenia_brevis.AAC.1
MASASASTKKRPSMSGRSLPMDDVDAQASEGKPMDDVDLSICARAHTDLLNTHTQSKLLPWRE